MEIEMLPTDDPYKHVNLYCSDARFEEYCVNLHTVN